MTEQERCPVCEEPIERDTTGFYFCEECGTCEFPPYEHKGATDAKA